MAKKKTEEAAPVAETPVVQQPVPEAPVAKKPKLGLLIIPIIVVLVLLAGIVTKVATSSPKAVFKNSINSSYKDVSKYLKKMDKFMEAFDFQENALYLKGDVKFSTNRSDLVDEELKNVNITFEAGIDLKHEEYINGISLEGEKETIGETAYYTDGETFVKATFLDDVYKIQDGDAGIIFDLFDIDIQEISELFELLGERKDDIEVDPETYDYLLKTVKNAVNKSLDSKSMKKEKAKFDVDGKTVNATKVSYIFTKSSTKELVNKVVDILLNDDKFLSKLADSTGLEKADVKDRLKDLKDEVKEDIDFDEEIKVNIYIKGLFNKVVGFSLEYDEKEYFTVFQNGKVTEATIDNHDKDDKVKIVATAVKNKKETEVTVKYNKDKIATGTIRKFEEKVVDFDLTIYSGDDSKSKATVYITGEQKKSTISGEFDLRLSVDDEYMSYAGSYTYEALDDLEGFKVSDAKEYDEDDDEELIQTIKDVIEKDDKLNAMLGERISDYEDRNQPDYNSNGMIALYWDEDFFELFTKNKAKVLYIGSSYYSSYYETEEAAVLKALTDAQTKYKFHSYYYPYYYMEDEHEEKLDDSYTCADTYNCDKYPAIYFIKDGKVKKVLRGTVTVEDIYAGLQEIGMK